MTSRLETGKSLTFFYSVYSSKSIGIFFTSSIAVLSLKLDNFTGTSYSYAASCPFNWLILQRRATAMLRPPVPLIGSFYRDELQLCCVLSLKLAHFTGTSYSYAASCPLNWLIFYRDGVLLLILGHFAGTCYSYAASCSLNWLILQGRSTAIPRTVP